MEAGRTAGSKVVKQEAGAGLETVKAEPHGQALRKCACCRTTDRTSHMPLEPLIASLHAQWEARARAGKEAITEEQQSDYEGLVAHLIKIKLQGALTVCQACHGSALTSFRWRPPVKPLLPEVNTVTCCCCGLSCGHKYARLSTQIQGLKRDWEGKGHAATATPEQQADYDALIKRLEDIQAKGPPPYGGEMCRLCKDHQRKWFKWKRVEPTVWIREAISVNSEAEDGDQRTCSGCLQTCKHLRRHTAAFVRKLTERWTADRAKTATQKQQARYDALIERLEEVPAGGPHRFCTKCFHYMQKSFSWRSKPWQRAGQEPEPRPKSCACCNGAGQTKNTTELGSKLSTFIPKLPELWRSKAETATEEEQEDFDSLVERLKGLHEQAPNGWICKQCYYYKTTYLRWRHPRPQGGKRRRKRQASGSALASERFDSSGDAQGVGSKEEEVSEEEAVLRPAPGRKANAPHGSGDGHKRGAPPSLLDTDEDEEGGGSSDDEGGSGGAASSGPQEKVPAKRTTGAAAARSALQAYSKRRQMSDSATKPKPPKRRKLVHAAPRTHRQKKALNKSDDDDSEGLGPSAGNRSNRHHRPTNLQRAAKPVQRLCDSSDGDPGVSSSSDWSASSSDDDASESYHSACETSGTGGSSDDGSDGGDIGGRKDALRAGPSSKRNAVAATHLTKANGGQRTASDAAVAAVAAGGGDTAGRKHTSARRSEAAGGSGVAGAADGAGSGAAGAGETADFEADGDAGAAGAAGGAASAGAGAGGSRLAAGSAMSRGWQLEEQLAATERQLGIREPPAAVPQPASEVADRLKYTTNCRKLSHFCSVCKETDERPRRHRYLKTVLERMAKTWQEKQAKKTITPEQQANYDDAVERLEALLERGPCDEDTGQLAACASCANVIINHHKWGRSTRRPPPTAPDAPGYYRQNLSVTCCCCNHVSKPDSRGTYPTKSLTGLIRGVTEIFEAKQHVTRQEQVDYEDLMERLKDILAKGPREQDKGHKLAACGTCYTYYRNTQQKWRDPSLVWHGPETGIKRRRTCRRCSCCGSEGDGRRGHTTLKTLLRNMSKAWEDQALVTPEQQQDYEALVERLERLIEKGPPADDPGLPSVCEDCRAYMQRCFTWRAHVAKLRNRAQQARHENHGDGDMQELSEGWQAGADTTEDEVTDEEGKGPGPLRASCPDDPGSRSSDSMKDSHSTEDTDSIAGDSEAVAAAGPSRGHRLPSPHSSSRKRAAASALCDTDDEQWLDGREEDGGQPASNRSNRPSNSHRAARPIQRLCDTDDDAGVASSSSFDMYGSSDDSSDDSSGSGNSDSEDEEQGGDGSRQPGSGSGQARLDADERRKERRRRYSAQRRLKHPDRPQSDYPACKCACCNQTRHKQHWPVTRVINSLITQWEGSAKGAAQGLYQGVQGWTRAYMPRRVREATTPQQQADFDAMIARLRDIEAQGPPVGEPGAPTVCKTCFKHKHATFKWRQLLVMRPRGTMVTCCCCQETRASGPRFSHISVASMLNNMAQRWLSRARVTPQQQADYDDLLARMEVLVQAGPQDDDDYLSVCRSCYSYIRDHNKWKDPTAPKVPRPPAPHIKSKACVCCVGAEHDSNTHRTSLPAVINRLAITWEAKAAGATDKERAAYEQLKRRLERRQAEGPRPEDTGVLAVCQRCYVHMKVHHSCARIWGRPAGPIVLTTREGNRQKRPRDSESEPEQEQEEEKPKKKRLGLRTAEHSCCCCKHVSGVKHLSLAAMIANVQKSWPTKAPTASEEQHAEYDALVERLEAIQAMGPGEEDHGLQTVCNACYIYMKRNHKWREVEMVARVKHNVLPDCCYCHGQGPASATLLGLVRMVNRQYDAQKQPSKQQQADYEQFVKHVERIQAQCSPQLSAGALPVCATCYEGMGQAFKGTGANVAYVPPVPPAQADSIKWRIASTTRGGVRGSRILRYHICSHPGCPAKKVVECKPDGTQLVVRYYGEEHNHGPGVRSGGAEADQQQQQQQQRPQPAGGTGAPQRQQQQLQPAGGAGALQPQQQPQQPQPAGRTRTAQQPQKQQQAGGDRAPQRRLQQHRPEEQQQQQQPLLRQQRQQSEQVQLGEPQDVNEWAGLEDSTEDQEGAVDKYTTGEWGRRRSASSLMGSPAAAVGAAQQRQQEQQQLLHPGQPHRKPPATNDWDGLEDDVEEEQAAGQDWGGRGRRRMRRLSGLSGSACLDSDAGEEGEEEEQEGEACEEGGREEGEHNLLGEGLHEEEGDVSLDAEEGGLQQPLTSRRQQQRQARLQLALGQQVKQEEQQPQAQQLQPQQDVPQQPKQQAPAQQQQQQQQQQLGAAPASGEDLRPELKTEGQPHQLPPADWSVPHLLPLPPRPQLAKPQCLWPHLMWLDHT